MNAAARRWLVAAAAVLAACGEAGVPHTLRWLEAQQADDGLWHSRTYAMLRRGESTTAALALVLARLPAPWRQQAAPMLTKALRGLAAAKAPSPATGPDPVDYPCYTAALRLHTLVLQQPEGWRDDAAALLTFLREHQLVTTNGWPREAPEFGGFGLGDRLPVSPLGGELVGLSVTMTVLEAVAAAARAGVAVDPALLADARVFVERCQRFGAGGDGGFCFAPTTDWRATKAGFDAGNVPRSYGTATVDGARALLALGDAAASPRVAAALRWLAKRGVEFVPGLDDEVGRAIEPSLRLYWFQSLAALVRRVPEHPAAPRWREAITQGLTAALRADGSYLGFGVVMKEDDPLVATALALGTFADG